MMMMIRNCGPWLGGAQFGSTSHLYGSDAATECGTLSDTPTWLRVSDATIYRPNDISSRYWPYRIVSISWRKILKFRYFNIGETSRCCLFIFFFVGNKSIELCVFTFFKSVVIMHCPSLIIIPNICITISTTDSTLIDRQNITHSSNHTGNNCTTQLTRRTAHIV